MDILNELKRNVPSDVYDKVFKYTMMYLFKECDVINAAIDAYDQIDLQYNKTLDDFVVYQTCLRIKFNNNYLYTSNEMNWGNCKEKDICHLMDRGMLRFKYLKIVASSDFTKVYVNYTDFISYTYKESDPELTLFMEKCHEVTMYHDQISTDKLMDLAQRYPDKSFVVTFETHPFKVDPKLANYIDVAKTCTNVKLNVRYFFSVSLMEIGFWENNFMNYITIFEHPHQRVELFTVILVDLDGGSPHELIRWLVLQMHKLGFDRINQFVVYGDLSEQVFPFDFRFIQKMTNLEKLTFDGVIFVNKDTVGNLSGLDKLRRLKITSDTYSNEWLSTCLPKGIERMTLFKSVKNMSKYYPIRLGENLKCLLLKHDKNDTFYNVNHREFEFKNPKCDMFIEDIALAQQMEGSGEEEDCESDDDMSDNDSGVDINEY